LENTIAKTMQSNAIRLKRGNDEEEWESGRVGEWERGRISS